MNWEAIGAIGEILGAIEVASILARGARYPHSLDDDEALVSTSHSYSS